MSDYLDSLDPNNLVNVVRELARRVDQLERKEVSFDTVEEVTNDLGLMLAGEFRSGNGLPPGEGFSGMRMSYPGIEFLGKLFALAGINNDVFKAGMSAEDGTIIGAGGAMTIDENAITLDGLLYAMRHTVSAGGQDMEGRMEMTTQEGLEIPSWQISYGNKSSGANLILNGDFATDDFTHWTKTAETNGVWTCSAADKSATFTTNSGVGTKTGELTSDSIAVSGTTSYLLTFGWSNSPVILIKWYDSGSALLRTDTITNKSYSTISPSGAVTCTVSLYVTTTIPTSYIYKWIEPKLVQVSILHRLGFKPHLRYNDGFNDGKLVVAENAGYPPLAPIASYHSAAGSVTTPGNHSYKITYVDKFGETLPSPASNVVNVPSGYRTDLKILYPAWADQVNIYSTVAGNTGDWKLARSITPTGWGGTSIEVNVADGSLGAAAPTVNTSGNLPQLPNIFRIFADEILQIRGTSIDWPIFTSTASQSYGFYANNSTGGAADGDVFETSFICEKGIYQINFLTVKSSSYGIFDVYIDDVLISSGNNLYAGSVTYDQVFTFSSVNIAKSGWHNMTFVINGKHASSTDYRFICTKITFIRTA